MGGEVGKFDTGVSKIVTLKFTPLPKWEDVQAFGAVARTGSLRGAAQGLNLQTGTVIKRVNSLEAMVGQKLFDRTPRGMVLTQPGRRVAGGADSIEMLIQETISRVRTARDIESRVRLLMAEGPADRWLIPNFLQHWMRRHPELALHLGASNEIREPTAPAFDVQLQYFPGTQNGLNTVRIGTFHLLFFASEDYLANFGTPQSEADFAEHRFGCVTPSLDTPNGFMPPYSNVDIHGAASIVSNSGLMIANAVQAGTVMGLLPSYIYLTAPNLVPVLPDIHYETGIYLNYSAAAAQRPEVRTLIDFLKNVVFDKRLPWFADWYEAPQIGWRDHLKKHLHKTAMDNHSA